MLLIGDIHINARYSKSILHELQSFVATFSDEKNIIFLGDYMYMFSYDRQALGELFDFFLELWRDGKNVYIMAGNHDWLNQHFVYHEGKKVADILNKQADNKLRFITEPEVLSIEGKDILFVPYNKGFLGQYIAQGEGIVGTSQTADIAAQTTVLLESKNYNEQLSGALNAYLLNTYKPGMVLIHHYYTAGIAFPGQQAKFDYKDISLHPLRTSFADRIISGHLHKAFVHENYRCAGSIRSTTSGERNQCKRLRQWNTATDGLVAHEVAINPYVTIESAGKLSKESIYGQLEDIRTEHKALLPTTTIQNTTYDLGKTSLILYSSESAEDIEQLIDPEVKQSIGDIQLKQKSAHHKDMTELLDITQYNVKESLLDRKELVKKYLLSRYGTEDEKYRTILSELNIL